VWLKLKPVHNALRAVVNPVLAQVLEDCAKNPQAAPALEPLSHRVPALLAEAKRSDLAKFAEVRGEGNRVKPVPSLIPIELFNARLQAALRLPALRAPWPESAQSVLPVAADADADLGNRKAAWGTVLAWCALEAIGLQADAHEPESTAAKLFDALRLREPLAHSFAACGLSGDEQWRSAARLRASFAHSAHPIAPYSWIRDPDVAWLIGLHEHEGVSYVVKEHLERLMWWMALPSLLDVAAEPNVDTERLAAIFNEIDLILRAIEEGGYRVDSLEEAARLEGKRVE
jgi:hypothetical protein